MSKHLGPIHYHLYHKITFLDKLNKHLLENICKEPSSLLYPLPLEEVIITTNIHQSLQDMIKIIQKQHALIVEKAVTINKAQFNSELRSFATNYSLTGSLLEIYTQYQDLFLHGMPCDHNLSIVEQTANCLVINIKEDKQNNYFHDQAIWNLEKETLVNAMLAKDVTCSIKHNRLSFIKKQNWINILEREHTLIINLLEALDKKTITIMNSKEIDYQWLKQCLYFISNYADKQHHQKEEEIVFKMLKVTTTQGRILVEQGMLVEHNQARYYVRQMKKLLSQPNNEHTRVLWIGYGQAYIDLLRRHIDKENQVAYPYANKMLNNDLINQAFTNYQNNNYEESLIKFLNRNESDILSY